MSVEWAKQSFQSLKEFSENREISADMDEDALALIGRYQDIIRRIESDWIWPPVSSEPMRKFKASCREVLSRLPDEVFSQVESEIGIILDDPSVEMLAVNVPPPRSPDGKGKMGIDSIAFFRSCLGFTSDALIGLIAHEFAHSFVRGRDYTEDEALVDQKARDWGFGYELDRLERAKKELRSARCTIA
jgi:hypothetical protein